MIETGIFATDEEIKELKEAVETSGIAIHIPRQSPLQLCHEIALRHGLPEIEGYYGILGNGEFVK